MKELIPKNKVTICFLTVYYKNMSRVEHFGNTLEWENIGNLQIKGVDGVIGMFAHFGNGYFFMD